MSFGRPQTPLTPEQLQRQQRVGLGLSALSDIFARRDPIANTLQRQAMLEGRKKIAERDALLNELAKNPKFANAARLVKFGIDPKPFLGIKPAGPLVQIVDQEGNFVMNMTREEAAVNTDEFKTKGFRITNIPTGEDPAPSNKEATNKLIEPLKEQFIASEKLIKGLNETGKILAENPEAANKLVAGGASAYTFVTSNIAGFQSLIDNNKDTKAYQDLQKASVSLEGNDYAKKIKDVALASNISESRIKDLAFAFAAARGQTGRGLSDRDFQNALDILSKGVNAEQKVALFEDVTQRIQSDYQIVSELAKRLNQNNQEVIDQINAIGSLGSFVNPFTQPSTTQTTPYIKSILDKYPPQG